MTAVTAALLAISPVFTVLWLASLAFAIFVIVDMARRPDWQWRAAGSNKVLWMVLEIVLLIGLLSIVIGVIYLAAIRPRLEAVGRQGGGGSWAGGPGWQGQAGQPGQSAPWGGSPYSPQGGPYGTAPGYPGQPPAGAPGPWAYPGAGTPTGQAPFGQQPYGQQPVAPPPPVENPPFGWYADPSGRHEKRYWDGTRWTEHVSDGEARSTDPVSG